MSNPTSFTATQVADVPTSYFVEKTLTFEPVSEEGLPEDPLPSQPPVAPLRNELVEPLVCDLSKGEVIKSGDYTVHVQYHPRGYVYTVYVYDKDMQPVRSMVPPVRLCPVYDPTHPFIPVMGINCWAIPQIMACALVHEGKEIYRFGGTRT
ncbi:hypothetical protein FISHEDRAFT_69819 [Fistulina hepatica ATCC 64428]|uniref:Uncharacterized protein n=1 Tax=Fistulina hepatica ATCC 64428 TaxID=1128425 RepID=A0A0D7AKK3_9AGAR|nr:hypothetical protein FISHEDRAFT_69819 [Fistulina hepatica ATCC 64428]